MCAVNEAKHFIDAVSVRQLYSHCSLSLEMNHWQENHEVILSCVIMFMNFLRKHLQTQC